MSSSQSASSSRRIERMAKVHSPSFHEFREVTWSQIRDVCTPRR